ncbi:hypothetical protein [Dickeya lacustris]|uniref:Uncharacterized protein n=1 Tax=Dickeya lacustris TaxID=2259638 RepID=A0ABY8GBL0_9GAMM|nr:hypothetical protein [Dickeya lacustris]WFN57311.1 hypothetical protein O1Q98_09020 [Dickeya lacustris]
MIDRWAIALIFGVVFWLFSYQMCVGFIFINEYQRIINFTLGVFAFLLYLPLIFFLWYALISGINRPITNCHVLSALNDRVPSTRKKNDEYHCCARFVVRREFLASLAINADVQFHHRCDSDFVCTGDRLFRAFSDAQQQFTE